MKTPGDITVCLRQSWCGRMQTGMARTTLRQRRQIPPGKRRVLMMRIKVS